MYRISFCEIVREQHFETKSLKRSAALVSIAASQDCSVPGTRGRRCVLESNFQLGHFGGNWCSVCCQLIFAFENISDNKICCEKQANEVSVESIVLVTGLPTPC